MKNSILGMSILAAMASTNAVAMHHHNVVYDEASLQQAVSMANADQSIHRIVFKRNAQITLTAPVVFTGGQRLTVVGNGATIDGSLAGSFILDSDLTAITEDGTLVFNTASDLSISNLTVADSATRGIVVNVPESAEGDDISVNLYKVNITGSALFGLHIDDNADEFDDGASGSNIGIDLRIVNSNFTANGTGAIDFDGVRVDERAEGDITSTIINTHIDGNGGDGIELDEAGNGSVDATMINVTLNNNGFYNEEDLDDAFDIDEADDGDIEVTLIRVEANNNMDEGLDFDEVGNGSIELKLHHVTTRNNADEGIKADEEDAGDIEARFNKVTIENSGDDGVQFTELGEGVIEAKFRKVTANNNSKYGIKMEQWVEEDEPAPVEEPGYIKAKKVSLSGNGKGDEIKVNNIIVK